MPVPTPSMSSASSTTLSVAPAATTIPFVPDTNTPASMWSERMVIDLVIVTAPKPPGSSTLISPAAAVLEMAPAKVLHGAVRLHGLASSPTPDTHVRVACACAGVIGRLSASAKPRNPNQALLIFIVASQALINSSTAGTYTGSARGRQKKMFFAMMNLDAHRPD